MKIDDLGTYRTEVAKIGDLCDVRTHTYQSSASDDETSTDNDGAFILDKVDLPVMGKACFLVRPPVHIPPLYQVRYTYWKEIQTKYCRWQSHTLGIDGFLYVRRTSQTFFLSFLQLQSELTQSSVECEKDASADLKNT